MGKSQTTQKKETSVKRSYHINHAPGQHITYQMRTVIQTVYNANLRKPKKDQAFMCELAALLGLPKSTFSDEIRRGTVPRPNTYRDHDIWDYSAEIAQRKIDEGNANKGCPMKMNTTVAKLLHTEIAVNRRSPYDALRRLEAMGFDNLPSERSVYYHIHHGDIGISPSQLPYRPTPGRKRRQKPRRSLKMPGNLAIEERPNIGAREEFGHWEMDTVVSGVHGKGGLLVLIERKTRYYIVVRLRAITQSEILRALRQAIRRGRFVQALTITTDNGSEFLDREGIEGLFKANCKTKVYYTHAYAAWEKGSVENANRIVRRWYPKGTDFSKVTLKRIEQLQNAINSIHRRLLEGKTANEAYLSAA